MRLALIALVAALTASPVLAQEHGASACTAMDVALPAGMADWNGGAAITTAPSPEHAAHVPLALARDMRRR